METGRPENLEAVYDRQVVIKGKGSESKSNDLIEIWAPSVYNDRKLLEFNTFVWQLCFTNSNKLHIS